MKKLLRILVLCAAPVGAAFPAAAQQDVSPRPAEIDTATIDPAMARQRIAAQRKAALERCETQPAAQRAVCAAEAEGREKIALAELEQQRSPSEANARRLADTKAAVDHEIAREKCNAQAGDAQAAEARAACLARAGADDAARARDGTRARQP